MKGRGGVKTQVLISGADAIRVMALEEDEEERRTILEHAGTLCASHENVFCACGDVIWKLERSTLMPKALFCGGPGVSEMLLSPDGTRLYALCGEADSVLMLDAQSGEPLFLNRAGVNPQQMVMDGDVLAIAGGESGCVLLLCARSLRLLHTLEMPGPVYSVALQEGYVYALCLTPKLSSLLCVKGRAGACGRQALSGMPGRLLTSSGVLFAAVDGALHALTPDAQRFMCSLEAPGRAAWMAVRGENVLLLDLYGEALWKLKGGIWRRLCTQAKAAALDGV